MNLEFPPDTPPGQLTVFVGDGSAATAYDLALYPPDPQSLDQVLDFLARIRPPNSLNLLAYRKAPGAVVAGEALPALPPSVAAILRDRGPGEASPDLHTCGSSRSRSSSPCRSSGRSASGSKSSRRSGERRGSGPVGSRGPGSCWRRPCSRARSAAATKIWVSDSASDFSSGEARGIAVRPTARSSSPRECAAGRRRHRGDPLRGGEGQGRQRLLATGDAGQDPAGLARRRGRTLATLRRRKSRRSRSGPTAPSTRAARRAARSTGSRSGKASVYYETKARYVWALAFSGEHALRRNGPARRDPPRRRRPARASGSTRPPTPTSARSSSTRRAACGRARRARASSCASIRRAGRRPSTTPPSRRSRRSRRPRTAASGSRPARPRRRAPAGEPISAAGPAPTASGRRAAGSRERGRARTSRGHRLRLAAPAGAARAARARAATPRRSCSSRKASRRARVWTSTRGDRLRPRAGRRTAEASSRPPVPTASSTASRPDRSSLERTFDEKQVTALAGGRRRDELRDAPLPADGRAAAGRVRLGRQGHGPDEPVRGVPLGGRGPGGAKVEFAFRSGESAAPDTTWSRWSPWAAADPRAHDRRPARPVPPVEGPDDLGDGEATARVRRVEAAYRNRNAAPVVESLVALGPNEVYARSASGGTERLRDDRARREGDLHEPRRAEAEPRRGGCSARDIAR